MKSVSAYLLNPSIKYISVFTQNMDTCTEFYRGLFQLSEIEKFSISDEEIGFLMKPSSNSDIALLLTSLDEEDTLPKQRIILHIEDIVLTQKILKDKGFDFLPPKYGDRGMYLNVTDPDGNELVFFEERIYENQP